MIFLSWQYGTESAIDIGFVDIASLFSYEWKVNVEL